MIEIAAKKIAVIGDLMLDHYIIGTSNRISPEAPIPVVEVKDEYLRFGGSANVCLNIASLGAIPLPFGVIGKDSYGEQFKERAEKNQIDVSNVIESKQRTTTVKSRIIVSTQQVARVDRELKDPISSEEKQELLERFKKEIANLSAVIFQDYNKGVITKELIHEVMILCKRAKLPVFVDPKFHHFFDYQNSFLFKPNLRELSDALARNLSTMDDYKLAMIELKEKLSAKTILLTLNAEGMILLDENDQFTHIPTMAAEVADVSGAGDTVIASLVSAFVSGMDLIESVKLANKAAGIVIRELGIVPIRLEQL